MKSQIVKTKEKKVLSVKELKQVYGGNDTPKSTAPL